jgi:hypothetical protein
MSRKPFGTCNLCGEHGELSKEHVPPEAAFNDRKVILSTADEYWNRGQGQGLRVRGRYLQGGHGVYTLCKRCNNTTGAWYGRHFVEWCRQGMEFLDKTGGRGSVLHFARVRPLPVIKQITTMFLALNGRGDSEPWERPLVRFVMNREARYLDPRYRFWVYYVAPGPLRNTPLCSRLDIVSGRVEMGMEFSFPPFGYVLTLDSEPEDRRPNEITGFSRYRRWEEDRITLNLAVLPTHGPTFGDYRSFKKMERRRGETDVIIGMG